MTMESVIGTLSTNRSPLSEHRNFEGRRDMADWQTTGNAATTPPVEFLGTTDNHPLVIKTNGAERVRIDEIGLVGIGMI